MKTKARQKYEPRVCSCCTQTLDYTLTLSRGTALAVIALANAVDRLGRNKVHVGREMIRDERDFKSYREMTSGGWMTYKMEGNMSVLHRHGLAAMDANEAGCWILTKKGAAFLGGAEVPLVAIVSKVSGHQEGYWEPGGTTTIHQLLKRDTPFWSVPEYVRSIFEPVGAHTASLFAA